MSKKELSYKEAFQRLQEIQAQIESNRLDVDELSAVLKESAGLLKFCQEKLFAVNEETQKILDTMQ